MSSPGARIACAAASERLPSGGEESGRSRRVSGALIAWAVLSVCVGWLWAKAGTVPDSIIQMSQQAPNMSRIADHFRLLSPFMTRVFLAKRVFRFFLLWLALAMPHLNETVVPFERPIVAFKPSTWDGYAILKGISHSNGRRHPEEG